MNEEAITFLYKMITLSFLLLEGLKLAVSVRERGRYEGLGHRLTKNCYIDTFLKPHCDSIFRALRLS